MKKGVGHIVTAMCWLLVCLMVPNTWAEATADSTTWEGSYEADVLPTADGWSGGAGNPAWVSVSDGILSYDTMQMAATGGATTDGSACWNRANPGFDFVTGASIEVRMRLNNADTITIPPAGMGLACIVEFEDSASGVWFNPVVQTLSASGYDQYNANVWDHFGEWMTMRVIALATYGARCSSSGSTSVCSSAIS